MKLSSIFLLLLFPLSLFAREIEWTDTDWTLEIRGAYFSPSSKKMRHLHSGGWTDYQVETSKRIHDFFDVWAAVNWLGRVRSYRDHGYNDVKNQSKIYVLPLSVGFKFIYPILPCTEVYLGVGGCYSFLNIYNHCSDYKRHELSRCPFKRHRHKTNYGAVIKLGIQYSLTNNLFIDVFADYLSQRFRFSHHDQESGQQQFGDYFNVSGFKFGAGLGVYF